MRAHTRLLRPAALVLTAALAGFTACTTPHQAQFRQDFRPPATRTTPLPLKVALVLPEEARATTTKLKLGCYYSMGVDEITFPLGQEMARLAPQAFAGAFQAIEVVPSLPAETGGYDVGVTLRAPTFSRESRGAGECTFILVTGFWTVFPFFMNWGMSTEIGTGASLIEASTRMGLAEAEDTGPMMAQQPYDVPTYVVSTQAALAASLQRLATRLATAPKVAALVQRRQTILQAREEAARQKFTAQIAEHVKEGLAAEAQGQLRAALPHYVEALSLTGGLDVAAKPVRDRLFALVRRLDPPPALPEEARRHLVVGSSKVKEARGSEEYRQARDHFLQASRLAPWAPEPYFNLGMVDEKLQDYPGAIRAFKLYLEAAPGAPDARDVQDEIYLLEGKVAGR